MGLNSFGYTCARVRPVTSVGSAMRAARPLFLLAALILALARACGWRARRRATCPCTVFGPADAPLGDALQDQPIEVGMKFRSDEDGFITALRFYKQANNMGTHVGHLWTSTGQQLAEVAVHGRDGVGLAGGARCRCRCRSPKDTTYVTSYHSSQGQFGFSRGYFFWRRRPGAAPRSGGRPRGRQRRLPLRGERLPRPTLERDQLLGRRRVRAGCRPRTRARRA